LDLWDQCLPQAEITINHLRPYKPLPALSAYEGFRRQKYDFIAHPLAPFGTLVVVHDKPAERGSWDPHGVKGFYLGPALQHYHSWRTWVILTQTERISDSLAWFPTPLKLPGSDPHEMVQAAIDDLVVALRLFATRDTLTSAQSRAIYETIATAKQSLNAVINLFSSATGSSSSSLPLVSDDLIDSQSDVSTPSIPVLNATSVIHPSDAVVPSAIEQRVLANTPVPTVPDANLLCNVTMTSLTRKARRRAQASARIQAISAAEASFFAPASSLDPKRPSISLTPRDRANISHEQVASDLAHSSTIKRASRYSGKHHVPIYGRSSAALNMTDDGRPLTYRLAKSGPDKAQWDKADDVELSRLLDSATLHPIHAHEQPPDRRKDTTYYNPQIKEKIDEVTNVKTFRVRGTAGGDRIHYPGDVSARTADIELVKLLLNKVISEPNTRWMTLDITDFYLHSTLKRPEYIRIQRKFISDATLSKYNLADFLTNNSVLFRVDKGMYGLP
jgi:hypothetical protein